MLSVEFASVSPGSEFAPQATRDSVAIVIMIPVLINPRDPYSDFIVLLHFSRKRTLRHLVDFLSQDRCSSNIPGNTAFDFLQDGMQRRWFRIVVHFLCKHTER